MINNLLHNQVFVFGSNLAGRHLAGAAKQAKEEFGAEEGVGEGMTGQSYAFPTLNSNFERRSLAELEISRNWLFQICNANSHKEFLLTKVGCGIAGYPEEVIKFIFQDSPVNLILPDDWKNHATH